MASWRWSQAATRNAWVLFIVLLAGCSGGDNPPPASSSNSPPRTGPGGVPTGQPGRFNDRVVAIITAPDASGDIYVGGHFTTYNSRPVGPVVRLRPDGSLNESFTLAAEVAPTLFGITALAPVDDGSGDIYVGFVTNIGLEPPSRVVRIWKVNPNGSVDRSFPPGEVTYSLAMTIFNTNIHTIVSVGDGSGRAYVCGVFDRYNGVAVSHIVRVTPSGTLDETFQSAADPTFTVIPSDDGSGDLYVMNWTLFDIVTQRMVRRTSTDSMRTARLIRPSPGGLRYRLERSAPYSRWMTAAAISSSAERIL